MNITQYITGINLKKIHIVRAMGIYYTNYLYYGFLIRRTTADKCTLTSNLKILKINDDRFMLYSKMLAINDGVTSLKLIPDAFQISTLKALNPDLDNTFFTDNLFTEELKESISMVYKDACPKFYVMCMSVTSLDDFSIGNLLYNIRLE